MTRVAAHVILGPLPEPFLAALLESLVGAADVLLVNDNAPDPATHDGVLQASWFGRSGRLIVDRTPFTDFSTARNVCLRLHREWDAGEWIAFVDADEVHAQAVCSIARNLALVPPEIDYVDGYTWHFFQSFELYTSIERRMAFFRYRSHVRWEGAVHEHLAGLSARRLALPYVYAHYGHVLPARRHAEKGRLYSSLGQPGPIVSAERLEMLDPAQYFSAIWPSVLCFDGEHPPAAQESIARLRRCYEAEYARAKELAARAQPPLVRARNVLRKLNFEQRWRARALNPLARRLMSP